MYITLELDTRYHERQKEKGGNQEKKPPATGSNPSWPPQGSSSERLCHKKNKKGKKFQASKDKPHDALLNKDIKLIGSEKERSIKEGLGTYFDGKHPIEKCFKRPQNKPGSSRGFPRNILIYSGATNSFIAKNFVLKYSLTISELPENIPLFILDSNESPALFIIHYTKCVVDLPSFPRFEGEFFIIDSPKGKDLIFGYYFLYHFNPIIDWKNGLITYDSSHKDSSCIHSSTSNGLATTVNTVALVGELKTPLLPSSVHIPSIIPSQSLILSREKVFKEIKDVEEDVSISSPHLFQGDMDLPPLSFHAPLEE
ncbi:hypothetical protein O181_082471 [Austropuccinia psidii MF-1]|uniref:Uncharacterized protein n=1 Tax=Austropuccinia psidii MF-1 TaxID=1389203 RepID=A0A9Q3IGZ1_9BASI|nr:hypothetical protein [Austropuccinia psidii MF-1]